MKHNLVETELKLDTSAEFCAARFNCPGKKSLIIGSLMYMEEVTKAIPKLHQCNAESTLWIAGDVNLPDIDWTTNAIIGNTCASKTNQILLDTIADIDGEQLVKFPTQGNKTLDLFISNRPTRAEKI